MLQMPNQVILTPHLYDVTALIACIASHFSVIAYNDVAPLFLALADVKNLDNRFAVALIKHAN